MVALISIIFSILLLIESSYGFIQYHRRFTHTSTAIKATLSAEEIAQIEGITSQAAAALGQAPPQLAQMMSSFLTDYKTSSIVAKQTPEKYKFNLMTFLKSIQEAIMSPYQFKPYHEAVREPFDYYSWGNDFLRPLIIEEESKLEGVENANQILEKLKKGENVVILSNHQTEADPQVHVLTAVISVLLEKYGAAELAEKMIFIAGHKVTNDPVCIPFSMGRNLICIHSKKYIKVPPEDAAKKQAQNLESMKAMGDLFARGGSVFWVAPSGGRDRPDETGEFVVAPFDSKTSSGLGEERSGKRGPVSVRVLEGLPTLGGLGDRGYAKQVEDSVVAAYKELAVWHKTQTPANEIVQH